MKILFIHRWVGVHEGGTETDIKNLMKGLTRRGHEVTLITREGGRLTDYEGMIRVKRVRKMPFESDFSYGSKFDPRLYLYTLAFMTLTFLEFYKSYLQGEHYNLISVHFITEAKVARLIRFLFRIPFSFSLEGYTDAEAREARRADLVFACSEEIVDRCEKNYGYKPILKPFGVDLSVFKKDVEVAPVRAKFGLAGRFVFLTVCRLEPRKDLPTLLTAAKEVLAKYPELIFLIVGEGIERERLLQKTVDLGIQSGVIFAGSPADSELPLFYAAGDAFVLPTLYEGFGIVFLEAMACGLPIISTTVGAVPEVVGEAGLLVPPQNPAELAKALEKIYLDRDLYRNLSQRALSRVKEKFNYESYLSKFESLCLDLIHKYKK